MSKVDQTQPTISTGLEISPEVRPGSTPKSRPSFTQTAAVLVLIPAVPGLLGSVAAMLLFYVSPARFNKLLALLPGETILRSLLFFAPAALFAVVLLAVLYARQGTAQPATGSPAAVASVDGNPLLVQFAARTSLLVGIPVMLTASASLLLSFVSPGRYQAFIDPLPGTRYIDALLPFVPLGMLLVVIPALLVVTNLVRFSRRQERRRAAGDAAAKFSRALVIVILVPSILLLGMAVAALALSYVSPPYFDRLLMRLTSEGVIRLGMLFGFSALMAVVLISSLFLLMRPGRVNTGYGETDRDRSGDELSGPEPLMQESIQTPPDPGPKSGPPVLVWILSTALFFTVTSSVALFGVALYLLIR